MLKLKDTFIVWILPVYDSPGCLTNAMTYITYTYALSQKMTMHLHLL